MVWGRIAARGDAVVGGPRRSRGDQHEYPLSGLVLVCCVSALVLTGVLTAAESSSGRGFTEVRASLEVVAGVLFFGAGLLQLAQWRVERDPARGHTGLALLALGFLAPRLTALGPTLHDDVAARVLSPWTATAVTGLALALGATGPGRLDRWVQHSRAVAAAVAAALLVLLYLPFLAGRALPFSLDVPRPMHLLVELGTAGLLFGIAARVHRRQSGEPGRDSGLELAVVTTMGVVWLLRAAAVVALQPWALAATVLMTLTAVMALVQSSRCAAEVFDQRDQRAAEAEESLSAALRTLVDLDGERRSFRHDARNSMFALNAAAQVLAEHGPELDQSTRLRLRDAIRGELAQLEELLTQQQAPGGTSGQSSGQLPGQRRFGLVTEERESA